MLNKSLRQRLFYSRHGIRIRYRCERCIHINACLLPLLRRDRPHWPVSPFNLDFSLDCHVSTLSSNWCLLRWFLLGSSWEEMARGRCRFDHSGGNRRAVYQPYQRFIDGWEDGYGSWNRCCNGYWNELCLRGQLLPLSVQISCTDLRPGRTT